jgi:TATA-box binding protein (TBP) (component of TFIID and TFIIIB)
MSKNEYRNRWDVFEQVSQKLKARKKAKSKNSLTDKILTLPQRQKPYIFTSKDESITVNILVNDKSMTISIASRQLNGLHIQKEIELVTYFQVSNFICSCSVFYHMDLNDMNYWQSQLSNPPQ